jgi:hypothetical protein
MRGIGDDRGCPAPVQDIQDASDICVPVQTVKTHGVDRIRTLANRRAQTLDAVDVWNNYEAFSTKSSRQCAADAKKQRIAGAKDSKPFRIGKSADFFKAFGQWGL